MSILSNGEFYGETTARRASAGLAVFHLEHRLGRRLPMHVHQQAYFSMVLEGNYHEETGRRAIDYAPLTIVYHPPGTAHVDEIGPRGVRFLMIEADTRLVEGCDELKSGYPTPLPVRASWIALRFLRDEGAFARESSALDLLATVGKHDRLETAPRWLAHVLDRVRDEYQSPPAIRELAAGAAVHPVHLARVVRRETGTTLASLLRQRRIEVAVSLLGSRQPLATIAARVGFSDQAHFTRSLRSVTGFTPAELRRLLRR